MMADRAFRRLWKEMVQALAGVAIKQAAVPHVTAAAWVATGIVLIRELCMGLQTLCKEPLRVVAEPAETVSWNQPCDTPTSSQRVVAPPKCPAFQTARHYGLLIALREQ
jgi:hypothetical protein